MALRPMTLHRSLGAARSRGPTADRPSPRKVVRRLPKTPTPGPTPGRHAPSTRRPQTAASPAKAESAAGPSPGQPCVQARSRRASATRRCHTPRAGNRLRRPTQVGPGPPAALQPRRTHSEPLEAASPALTVRTRRTHRLIAKLLSPLNRSSRPTERRSLAPRPSTRRPGERIARASSGPAASRPVARR